MTDEKKSNTFNSVDGTVNITDKGDVRSVYNYYLGAATERATQLSEESVSKADLDAAYARLCARWNAVYEEFKEVFPEKDQFFPAHVPKLRGEIYLIAGDLARLRAMIARLDRCNKEGVNIRARDYQMVYMDIFEALGHIERSNRPVNSCYVVTATYGIGSRQAALVHARCRRRFVFNPFLAVGWCLYNYYGPRLARWSRSSSFGFRVCKALIADPIIHATDKRILLSIVYMAYLTLLSLPALLLLPLFLLIERIVFLSLRSAGVLDTRRSS